MGWVIVGLVAVIVGMFFYIRQLRSEIVSYRTTWSKIEDITDHNKDGDVIIHAKHLDS